MLLCLTGLSALGQVIQGQITDADDNRPVEDVIVTNIHTEVGTFSDKQGKFSLPASSEQLIEFRKEGYQVMRFRIPKGNTRPFYKVAMKTYNPAVPMFENMAAPDYKTDSLKYALLYKKELEFPQLNGVQAIQHPFSAMSKKNQQIWAFQKEYVWYQQQKYIDYMFSDNLITSITNLTGDSLQIYKQLFRPTFDELRNMGEYKFLVYIKNTVQAYRKRGMRARMGVSRSTR